MKKILFILLLSISGFAQLNITTTGNKFQSLNISVNNDVYSVEIKGICTVNNASHFGLGLKDGNNFNSIIYRGTTGAVQELLFNTNTLKTPDFRSNGTTFVVGDTIGVKIYFENGKINFKTSKNGVWSVLTNTNKTFINQGDLYCVIRSTSTWSNITTDIQYYSQYLPFVYISPNGNDNNDGAINNPFKTIGRALDATKGIGTIVPLSGVYYNDTTFDFKRSIKIDGQNNNVSFDFGEKITSANFVVGSSKVYEITHAPIAGDVNYVTCWIDNVNDPNSLILANEVHELHKSRLYRMNNLKSTYKASVSLLESSDPSRSYWFQSGGKIYFTIPQGTNLAVNPFVIPSRGNNTNFNHVIGGGKNGINVNISNIEFSYAPMDLTNTTFNLYNVNGNCSNTNHIFQYGYCANSTFSACEAWGCNSLTGGVGDGFNAHSDIGTTGVYNTNVMFENCYAHDNMDDGISWHQYCYSFIFNCLVEYNGSGITPASGGDGDINYCIVRKNQLTGIAIVGEPLDNSGFSWANVTSCLSQNNGVNYDGGTNTKRLYLFDCTASGIGGGFSTVYEAIDCIFNP